MITHDLLTSVLAYDPLTGVFTNITRRANCVHGGEIAGHINSKGYRVIKLFQKAYKAHRLAVFYVTGEWPVGLVDHRNGNKDDNRIKNLRDVDKYINAQNRRVPVKGCESGLLGAHRGGWKSRKWVSKIYVNGVPTFLGVFKSADDAHKAYLVAKRKHHEGCTL